MWYHGLQPRWYWHSGAVSSVSGHSLAVQSPYQCPSVRCQSVEWNNICVMLNVKDMPATSTVFKFQICLKLNLNSHTLESECKQFLQWVCIWAEILFALLLHLQHDHICLYEYICDWSRCDEASQLVF